MSKKKKDEEEDWTKDKDVQEFLEWADKPGPWDEQHDKTYTVGGLTADKDKDFMKFQKKIKEQEDLHGPNKTNGV